MNADYVRAVLEGIAMNLSVILEAQREHMEGKELVLTGGGAKGDVLAQILSRCAGRAASPAGSCGNGHINCSGGDRRRGRRRF